MGLHYVHRFILFISNMLFYLIFKMRYLSEGPKKADALPVITNMGMTAGTSPSRKAKQYTHLF